MLNVVLPMAGVSPVAEELGYPYPSPLVELKGATLISRVVENLNDLGPDLHVAAILRAEDCRRFHLDSTIRLLCGDDTRIFSLQDATAGALCSVLMAVEHYDSDEPLVIANSDQIFDEGVLSDFMAEVRRCDPDAACPTFESVHPRWSYLRLDGNQVVESIEKNPISRHAVAGLYYFKSGKFFAEAAMRAVLNGRDMDGRYYISAALNEYILADRSVLAVPIEGERYYSLFTAQRVHDYEQRCCPPTVKRR